MNKAVIIAILCKTLTTKEILIVAIVCLLSALPSFWIAKGLIWPKPDLLEPNPRQEIMILTAIKNYIKRKKEETK